MNYGDSYTNRYKNTNIITGFAKERNLQRDTSLDSNLKKSEFRVEKKRCWHMSQQVGRPGGLGDGIVGLLRDKLKLREKST